MDKEQIKQLLFALHHSTFRNEKQIHDSKTCGCFYCETIFRPDDVVKWCDNDGEGDRTALCPHCGIDSVIGDACEMRVTPDLLRLMNMMFFGEGIDNVEVSYQKADED